jgi:CubicO group peptidase (beta-lactamase class C family)
VESGLDVSPGFERTDAGASALEPLRLRATAPNGTTMVSTARDLAAMARALLGEGTRVLDDAALARMAEPAVPVKAHLVADAFCLGPYRRLAEVEGETVTILGHGGRWAGGVCDVLWVPERGIAIAVACNTPSRAGALILGLTDELLPRLVGPGAAASTSFVELADEELARYAGRYATRRSTYEVSVRDGGLDVVATAVPDPDAPWALPGGEQRLFPVGDDRFMPHEDSPVERRLQEAWFALGGDAGDFFSDGFVTAKRTD